MLLRVHVGVQGPARGHPGPRWPVIPRSAYPGGRPPVIPRNGTRPPASTELRTFMLGVLPEYMVPAAFVGLDEFPRTTTGKVDRNALPAPEEQPDDGSAYVAPRNELEETLAQIWAEILCIERVGVNDNFFDLGGDSILSLQGVGR